MTLLVLRTFSALFQIQQGSFRFFNLLFTHFGGQLEYAGFLLVLQGTEFF